MDVMEKWLINPNYKADIFHDLLPHLSFALFLWLMVGAAFYYTWKNLRQQIQLNALRDEFVSNITHELKTPITTVSVALESLKCQMKQRLSATVS
jgi:signal transduction histidine kinase